MTSRALIVIGQAEATTLVAAVAGRAIRDRQPLCVIDLDCWGGGLDVVLGLEHCAGVRWPDLAGARGAFDPDGLLARLPARDGVAVLSFDRRGGPCVEAQVIAAAVEAVRCSDCVVLMAAPSPEQALPLAETQDLWEIVSAGRLPGLAGAFAARAWLMARGVSAEIHYSSTGLVGDPAWEEELCEASELPLRAADWRAIERGRLPGGRRSKLAAAAGDMLHALLAEDAA